MSDLDDQNGLAYTQLTGLSPEAEVLLALSRISLSTLRQERLHRFITAHGRTLDWGFFIDQAARHGVLPLVGRNLIKLRLAHSEEGRALIPYRWIYSFVYEGNRRRNLSVSDEYAKVVRALNTVGIEYAIRKGPVLIEDVYHDLGLRRMGDFDLLLRRQSLPGFAEIAESLGYRSGHLSRNAEQVVPFDRRTQLVWQVSLPNSTLPFLKAAQGDDVEAFVLDPCFNLFQPRSGIKASVDEFLARAGDTVAFGEPARKLDAIDQIIDSCVQLHVEATTLMYIELGKDLMLLKFLDLVELIRRLPNAAIPHLLNRVREYECGDSTYWALYHANQLYAGELPEDLCVQIEDVDPDVLEVYGVLDGSPQRWERSFAQRLFDPQRWQSAAGRSTVPGPRAVV